MFINISLKKKIPFVFQHVYFSLLILCSFPFFKKKKDTKTCYITIINKVNDTIMKLFSGFV